MLLPEKAHRCLLRHFIASVATLPGFTCVRPTTQGVVEGNRVEVRIDGPSKQARGQKTAYVFEVNLLTTVMLDTQQVDITAYKHQVQAFFERCIPVYDLDVAPPPQPVLGYLRLATGFRKSIAVADFGILNSPVPLTQFSCEGHYNFFP